MRKEYRGPVARLYVGVAYTRLLRHVAEAKSGWLRRLAEDGTTILGAVGFWRGESEMSSVLIVAGWTGEQVDALAEALRVEFDQTAVLVETGGFATLHF